MIPLIDEHREEIAVVCRRFGVARLEAFGSVCTPAFDPATSDIDFLVTYPPDYDFGPWLSRLQDLEAALGEIFGRAVDVVTMSALNNRWFRREANKTRTIIYDASEVSEVA